MNAHPEARDLPNPPAAPAAGGERRAGQPAVCIPDPMWLEDLQAGSPDETAWLWRGYLAAGSITLLTSQWKAGKTTLAAVLLARLQAGGELAGLPVAPGKAAVVCEESRHLWYIRSRKLGFGRHVCWLCRPFRGRRPRSEEWQALIDRLAGLHAEHGLSLVVIDPLADFLPSRGEGDAGRMLDMLLPLQLLTDRGLAVLLLHHPRKGEPLPGQAARGSGALTGHVDVLVEMYHYRQADDGDRRRRLQAYSRYDETPRQLVIELTADGTDYLARGDFQQDEFTQSWELLHGVLEEAPCKLTRQKILQQWPEGRKAPSEATLWKWLDGAVARGLVCRDGSGKRNDPFYYWLPGQLEQWQQDPVAWLHVQSQESLRSLRANRPGGLPGGPLEQPLGDGGGDGP